MPKKADLIAEAKRWKLRVRTNMTKAQIQRMIDEAKEKAHAAKPEPEPAAPKPAAPKPPPPPPAPRVEDVKCEVVSTVVLGRGDRREPGDVVVLSTEDADSLEAQGAVKRI